MIFACISDKAGKTQLIEAIKSLLVTRGSVEPHYDWILTTEINSNPCPNWV